MSANKEGNVLTFTFKKIQKRFSELLYNKVTKTYPRHFVSNSSPEVKHYYSGKWLLLPPSPSNSMENNVFRVAIAYKLNLNIIKEGFKCVHCRVPIDTKGYHFLSCNQASLKLCHNMVRDTLADFYRSIGYDALTGEIPYDALRGISVDNSQVQEEIRSAAELEPFRSDQLNVRSNSSNNKQSTSGTRVDILVTKSGEQDLFCDVQVVNSLAPSFISMEDKEKSKKRLHEALVNSQGGRYFAPTFDCLGNPSVNTEKTLKSMYDNYIAALPTRTKHQELAEGRVLNYWLSRISFTINCLKAQKTLLLINDLKGNLIKSFEIHKKQEVRAASGTMQQGV